MEGEQEGQAPQTAATPSRKRALARAHKGKRPEKRGETVTLTKTQFDELMGRLAALEKDKAEQAAGPEIEITPATPTPDGHPLQPGALVNISADPARPDFRKVRWNRDAIKKAYPEVEFTPEINVTVSPHGIPYELTRHRRVSLPCIVREFHDAEVFRQEHQYDRYRRPSTLESFDIADRAMASPGQPVYSRLYIAGHGLVVNPDGLPGMSPEREGAEGEAAPAKA